MKDLYEKMEKVNKKIRDFEEGLRKTVRCSVGDFKLERYKGNWRILHILTNKPVSECTIEQKIAALETLPKFEKGVEVAYDKLISRIENALGDSNEKTI